MGVPPAYVPTAKPPPPHGRLHPQAKEKRNRRDDLVIPGTREDYFFEIKSLQISNNASIQVNFLTLEKCSITIYTLKGVSPPPL